MVTDKRSSSGMPRRTRKISKESSDEPNLGRMIQTNECKPRSSGNVTLDEIKSRIAEITKPPPVPEIIPKDHRREFYCVYQRIFELFIEEYYEFISEEDHDTVIEVLEDAVTQEDFEFLNDFIKQVMEEIGYTERNYFIDFPDHEEVFERYSIDKLDKPGPSREYEDPNSYGDTSLLSHPFLPKKPRGKIERLKIRLTNKIEQLAELRKMLKESSINRHYWYRRLASISAISNCKLMGSDLSAELKSLNPFYPDSDSSTDFSDMEENDSRNQNINFD